MKKIYFMLGAALFAAACTAEMTDTVAEDQFDGLQEYVFNAGYDATKTTFDGTDFLWTPGDRISVFDSALKNRRFETSDNTVSASFTGRAKQSSCFYAFYPYDASLVMSEAGVLKAAVPTRQSAKANTIVDGMNISMGRLSLQGTSGPDAGTFLMKNVGGYVKIVLGESSTPITSMRISAKGREGISGDVKVDYTGENPVTVPDGASPVIGLVPDGGSFGAGTYYAVANPIALSEGLMLKLVRNDYRKAEISLNSAAIVRNSAKGTTFNIQTPDQLDWVLPDAYKLQVNFVNRDDLSLNQPFDETVPTKSPSTDLVRLECHLKDSGEEFVLCSTNLGINTSMGLRLDKDGYVTLPAIPGKRLSKLTLTYGTDSPKQGHEVAVTPDEDNAQPVAGGESKILGPDAVGKVYSWEFSDTEENTSYRVVSKNSEKNLRIRFLDLEYLGFDDPSVSSVNLTGASIKDNAIKVSGLLNVLFPESGYFSWGVEYREESIAEWTKGPSGNGTEFDVTIDNIDASKIWYVRAYGRVDAEDKVYSSERKLEFKEPIVIKLFFSKVEYNGTASGGYWLFTGDRNGYEYPTGTVKRNSKPDEYSYYANPEDTDPLLTGIIIYDNNASKGYSFPGAYMQQYGGYIKIPGKRDYRVNKVVCTIHASAGSGKNVTVTSEKAETKSQYKLGVTPDYSMTGSAQEELTVNCDGAPDEGIKLWPSVALYWDAIEITYAP